MLEFIEKPGFVIVLLVALVVFGSKRLPDSARSLGRSMRILKAEAKGLKDDDSSAAPATAAGTPPAAAVPIAAAPVEPPAGIAPPAGIVPVVPPDQHPDDQQPAGWQPAAPAVGQPPRP